MTDLIESTLVRSRVMAFTTERAPTSGVIEENFISIDRYIVSNRASDRGTQIMEEERHDFYYAA